MRKHGYVPPGEDDLFNMTVPHVCGDCNSGWMSDIETKAKRHVVPFIFDDYRQMGALTQQTVEHVSRWSYLKVISLELGRPSEHTPTHQPSTYSAFKKTRLPPYPNSSLAIGARERITDGQPTYIFFTSQAYNAPFAPLGDELHWYETTLCVGHLVISLIGLPDRHRLNVHHAEGLQPIWPLIREGGEFRWPPDKRLRLEDGKFRLV
jgi:hypothetical protein